MDGACLSPVMVGRQPKRRLIGSQQLRYAALLLATLMVPLSFRVALCMESTVLLTAADLLGLYSDLCVTAVWTVLVILAGSRSRVAAYLLMAVWCLLHAANYEHVRALGTLPSLSHVGQLAEPEFLWGSALVISRPFLLAGLLVLAIAALRTVQPHGPLNRQTVGFAAFALSINLGLLLCRESEQSARWRQTHPLAMNISKLWNQVPPPADLDSRPSREVRHRVRQLLHRDLSGRSILPEASRPHNVLLIVLESVSGAHLEPISRAQGRNYPSPMPRLSKLAADNMYWTQFVTQQRQTNRGLYSLMAGRYPQLNYTPSFMTDYVPDPQRPPLPAVLRDAGYETVFLQAADLEYMQKGRFMRSAGFNRVMGGESFADCHFRSGWGPDDRTVMEKGGELIRELKEQGKPWFLTVFTVGTHHPYVAPPEFQSAFPRDSFEHTAAYADVAVDQLIARLKSDGTLKDTLVLVTSDESGGVHQHTTHLEGQMSHNWGFLLAVTPEGTHERIDEPCMQSDLALSIVDYLGLADHPQRFVGRSVFRHYEQPRPIVCANVYFGNVMLFDVDGSVSICPDDFHGGRTYQLTSSWLFGRLKPAGTWDASKTDFMMAVVRSSVNRAPRQTMAHYRNRHAAIH